jgi:hypothetical protein
MKPSTLHRVDADEPLIRREAIYHSKMESAITDTGNHKCRVFHMTRLSELSTSVRDFEIGNDMMQENHHEGAFQTSQKCSGVFGKGKLCNDL